MDNCRSKLWFDRSQGKFFFLGALVEMLLIACFFWPEGWLLTELHNFALVTHIPVLAMLESCNAASSAIFVLLLGFAGMSCLWGLLISLAAKGFNLLLLRLDRNGQRFVWLGAVGASLICLALAIVPALPQHPRPFESSPEIRSVVDANNEFALDLFQKLKDKPGNLFCSPFSLSSAMAMTHAGARGQTEIEIANALHFNLPPEKLHSAFKALLSRLESVQRWDRITLKNVNSFWCQKDYSFTADFLKTAQDNYSAEAKSADFKHSAGAAAHEINRWIEAKTNHKIPGTISAGQLTAYTRLALCDAIYFKGKWLNQFKKKNTKPNSFHISTNQSVTVPMMWQSAVFKQARTEDDSVEMLEMPYVGQDLSMIVLLPGRVEYVPDAQHNDVHDLEQKLTAENLRSWLKMLGGKAPGKTSVSLPRFTISSSFNLTNELKSLGMGSAFSDAADFSGMDGTKQLYLSDVFHQTFVEVNETGTEAAAMTLPIAKSKGGDDRFTVDHPFIFLIRDNGSGSILFLGRIIDPTK